ncbi:MAG: hypothetical protein LIV24_11925 [Eubacterium sp.]|nr:hypothetical protein [Eubacterium sp.]
MSIAVLCQIKRTDHPFYIRDIDLNIYSIEELCWFLNHNLALAGDAFFDDSLQGWVGEELKDQHLVRTMENIRREGDRITDKMVHAINAETGWIYVQDREAFEKAMEANHHLPAPERLRRRADALVGYRKYARAIEDYRKILSLDDLEGLGAQFIGTVYNNMGVTYARLFQMDEAVECLKKASENLHADQTEQNCLCAAYLSGGEKSFENLADELKTDPERRNRLLEEMKNSKAPDPEGDIDSLLGEWVQDYHRETGL